MRIHQTQVAKTFQAQPTRTICAERLVLSFFVCSKADPVAVSAGGISTVEMVYSFFCRWQRHRLRTALNDVWRILVRKPQMKRRQPTAAASWRPKSSNVWSRGGLQNAAASLGRQSRR